MPVRVFMPFVGIYALHSSGREFSDLTLLQMISILIRNNKTIGLPCHMQGRAD